MSSLADQTQLEESLLRPHADKTKRLPTKVEQFKIREVRKLAKLAACTVQHWLNEYEGTGLATPADLAEYRSTLAPFLHLLPKKDARRLTRRLRG
jgi:hypothetical protein